MSDHDTPAEATPTATSRSTRHLIISSRETCWLVLVCMVAGFLLGRWIP